MKRKPCPNIKFNEEDCPCVERDCENHGTCCECVRHHLEYGGKPACMR